MKINTNINLKDRKMLTLGEFKGLDTLSAKVDVSAIHATEMQNFISRDGINHKRYGWATQARIRDSKNNKYLSIKGIFNFTIFRTEFLLVYAGERFWWVNGENYEDITTKTIEIKNNELYLTDTSISSTYRVITANLKDRECKHFINGDKVYFVGCGDFLVFSQWSNNKFELRRVFGNEDIYIPTTTENIGCEETGKHYTRITAEERNLLSPYYYNTLFGPDEINQNETATYYLDSNETVIEITVNNTKLTPTKESSVSYKKYITGEIIKEFKFEINDNNFYFYFSGKALPNNTYAEITVTYNTPDVLVAEFENDGRLILRTEIIKYETAELSNQDMGISCTYNKPKTVKCLLVYIDYQGNESIIFSDTPTFMVSATVGRENSYFTVSGRLRIANTPYTLKGDLTKYNVKLVKANDGLQLSYSSDNAVTNDSITYNYKDSETHYTAYYKDGILKLNGVQGDIYAYNPSSNKPNVIVKFKQSITDYEEAFKKINIACLFGTQGTSDRLFVAIDNIVRWSKDVDFTYFGHKSWCVCGTADKKITGMDRLNDSTLLVAKEYSVQEPSIFVISGQLVAGKTEADTTEYTALFTPHGYKVGMGAIGEVVNFNGDCLMVSNDGLYAIALGENMTVDSRYILHRSRQISNKLEKYELSKAKCISFNGKLFVAVDGECYVADSKYTASFKGDMQNAINYEWWRWTNIPVSVWGINNNELWFGTEDGQLCKFTEKFYDEEKVFLKSGLVEYEFDTGGNIIGLVLVDDLSKKFSTDDEIVITCDFYGIDGKNLKNKPLFIQKEKEIDEYGQPYDYFTLLDIDDNQVKCKSVRDGNPSTDNFTAVISHKETVVANWETGEMDLGTRAYSKTLTFIGITGESDLANRLKYGIKTRLGKSEFELRRANNDLDFEKLDLETLSLDSQFGSTYTRRLNMRNVNFIQLYFKSESREDIAINSIQIEFKINKRNIGVR